MKKKFGFYKNIIMVAASALTLIAVTFAWFTSNFQMDLDGLEMAIDGETLEMEFYQADENQNYQPLSGDIELDDFIPGKYNQYKFIATTKTADKLKMSFSIDGLPEDLPQELADAVCIRYSVYKLKKSTAANGEVSYINDKLVVESADYVPLSALSDGEIFSAVSLANYQTSSSDKFAIYYEIGLSEEAPISISGLESDLGNVRISAQRIG